jgi:spermidine synthase
MREPRAVLVRILVVAGIATVSMCAILSVRAAAGLRSGQFGRIESEVKSDYSHIRIRRRGDVRTLLFVRDNGQEVVETSLQLDRPHELLSPYTRFMFLSYLFHPRQEKVLIVGLGGGSMVHFLKRYDPGLSVDVVEIDPVIVRIADELFNVRSEGRVRIVTADGVDYLESTQEKYDVIYLDAFLRPSPDTDRTGVPLALKTSRFYQQIQERLTPRGIVVCNLNSHAESREDIKTIATTFAQTYVYEVSNSSNLVVVASPSPRRMPPAEMAAAAEQLDRRFGTSFSFQQMARRLVRSDRFD